MIKKFEYFLYWIFILVCITSCFNDSSFNKDKIFRYNEHSNISSLDPAFSSTLRNIWPVNQLFNGLVQLDDSLNIYLKAGEFQRMVKLIHLKSKKIFFFINQ